MTVAVSEHFVISAVRYALGRATYIVGVLAFTPTGMDMDRQEWQRLIRHANSWATP